MSLVDEIPTEGRFAGFCGDSMWKFFFEEPPYCFPQHLSHFVFPSRVHRGFHLSMSLPTLMTDSPKSLNGAFLLQPASERS